MRTSRKLKMLFLLAGLFCLVFQTAAFSQTNESEVVPPDYSVRDPFWPAGYKKVIKPAKVPEKVRVEQPVSVDNGQEKPVEIENPDLKWPELPVKGTLTGPAGYLAVIEGVGIVEKGSVVSLRKDGMIFSYKIDEITGKGVSYTKLTARSEFPGGK